MRGNHAARIQSLEERAREAEEVSGMLDSLLSRVLEKIGEPARRRAVAAGRHPWIGFPPSAFISLLLRVRDLMGDDFTPDTLCPLCGVLEVGSATFVDVGCGVGDKVVLASDLGFETHGIEVDPAAVRKARRTFPLRLSPARSYDAPPPLHAPGGGAMTLYPRDALGFDFSGFSVIYYYRPFADDALEKKLEARIWKQARPGAFVIACSGLTRPPGVFREVPIREPVDAKVYRRAARAGSR